MSQPLKSVILKTTCRSSGSATGSGSGCREYGDQEKLLNERIAPNLKEGAILSTNTSGLSVNEMAESLPEACARTFS